MIITYLIHLPSRNFRTWCKNRTAATPAEISGWGTPPCPEILDCPKFSDAYMNLPTISIFINIFGAVRIKINLPGKNRHVTEHTFASLNWLETNLTVKIGRKTETALWKSELNALWTNFATASCYISDMFVKPRAVQCSCPSDMFELLDQAPPSPVQLS